MAAATINSTTGTVRIVPCSECGQAHGTHEPAQTLLLGIGADPQQAALAQAEGADLLDVRAATPGALAAIRASLPGAVLWADPGADRGRT